MRILYDLPIGNAEPHYAQIIKADKLKCWEVYPEVGWDTLHQAKHDNVPTKGSIRRKGDTVEVATVAIRSHFDPERVAVRKGQKIHWTITNLERTRDVFHHPSASDGQAR